MCADLAQVGLSRDPPSHCIPPSPLLQEDPAILFEPLDSLAGGPSRRLFAAGACPAICKDGVAMAGGIPSSALLVLFSPLCSLSRTRATSALILPTGGPASSTRAVAGPDAASSGRQRAAAPQPGGQSAGLEWAAQGLLSSFIHCSKNLFEAPPLTTRAQCQMVDTDRIRTCASCDRHSGGCGMDSGGKAGWRQRGGRRCGGSGLRSGRLGWRLVAALQLGRVLGLP